MSEKKIINLKNKDVIILCGGLGKRLRKVVDDRPKVLAEIKGKPFLDILIEYFSSFGCERFILCTGYKGNKIQGHIQNKYNKKKILISQEKEPLGTGGALLHAFPFIKSDSFFVTNGDSLCEINLKYFFKYHILKNALITIALIKTKNSQRFGNIEIDNKGKILNFKEKEILNEGWINAGIYLMNKDIFSFISSKEKKLSLEYDLFPQLVNKRIYGMKLSTPNFIDIGTPESYLKAQKLINKIKNS